MTIKMDKQIIFENIEQWKEFCDYANSNLEWSNPLLGEFETWNFNEFRKTDKLPWDPTGMVDYLFIGIKDKKVYIFVHRTPTDKELDELIFKSEMLKDLEIH